MTKSRLIPARLLGLAAASLAAVLMAAPSSEAYPTARVETQTRPDFGLLLNPPPRRRPHRPRGPRPDGRYLPPEWTLPPWDGRLQPVALVDCSDARSPHDVNRALASLEPGGTLILRTAGNQGCLDGVRISKPVTIQGDGSLNWRGRRIFRGLAGDPARDDPFRDQSGDGAYPDSEDAEDSAPPDRAQPGEDPEEVEEAYERMPSEMTRLNDEMEKILEAAHFKTPGNRTCIDIAPSAGRVVLRNLVISAANAGDQPCIYSERANLRLENTVVHYNGQGPAIVADGGKLDIEDSLVLAFTHDRAIIADRAEVKIRGLTLTGDPAIGIELVSPSSSSEISDIEVYSKGRAPAFGPSSVGLVISGTSQVGANIAIVRARICGFGAGIWQQGANRSNIRRSHICRATTGIVTASGEMFVSNTAIGARLIGVKIGASHETNLSGVHVYGARYDVFVEPGAREPTGSGNLAYTYAPDVGRDLVCMTFEVNEQHGDYRRYKRNLRRTGRLLWMPGYRRYGGHCEDPSQLDGRWLAYERRLGYRDLPDQPFYRLTPWPQERMYHTRVPGWTIDGKPDPQAPAPR